MTRETTNPFRPLASQEELELLIRQRCATRSLVMVKQIVSSRGRCAADAMSGDPVQEVRRTPTPLEDATLSIGRSVRETCHADTTDRRAAMTDKSAILFRPAANREELESLLRLRFSVYSNPSCRFHGLCDREALGFELDAYDGDSHHLGLFAGTEKKAVPIGYVRLVTTSPGPHAIWFEELANECPERWAALHGPRVGPLPCFDHLQGLRGLRTLYESKQAAGRRLIEPSRLSIDPSFRRSTLSRFLILGCAAYALHEFSSSYVAILICATGQCPVYRALGFQPTPGAQSGFVYGVHVSSLTASHYSFPGLGRRRIEEMAEELFRTGSIRFSSQGPRLRPRKSDIPRFSAQVQGTVVP